jgi:hypothetical protein
MPQYVGRNNDRYCRCFRHISGDTPENLQIVLCALRNLFFIPVISGHLTFEVETSTRSQNVQQTPVTAHIISE